MKTTVWPERASFSTPGNDEARWQAGSKAQRTIDDRNCAEISAGRNTATFERIADDAARLHCSLRAVGTGYVLTRQAWGMSRHLPGLSRRCTRSPHDGSCAWVSSDESTAHAASLLRVVRSDADRSRRVAHDQLPVPRWQRLYADQRRHRRVVLYELPRKGARRVGLHHATGWSALRGGGAQARCVR